jgi:hypothetical protein
VPDQQFKGLRRRVRHSLQRQWQRSLAGLALLIALGQAPVLAATINSLRKINGKRDMRKAFTSYVERQNLTMRMSMRRFTRLTNGFSKKLGNYINAIRLRYMYYNFRRIHKKLWVTLAMEAGISDDVWSLEEIAN